MDDKDYTINKRNKKKYSKEKENNKNIKKEIGVKI